MAVAKRIAGIALLALLACAAAEAATFAVDTTDDAVPLDEVHPQQMLRRAVHQVQRGREALEQQLADAWCAATPEAPLYVDGGLAPVDQGNAPPFPREPFR